MLVCALFFLGFGFGAQCASAFTYEGFVVDNYCWNKPNHKGIDGALLGSAPGTHILHCLTCCGCDRLGYTVLEELGPSSYAKKYELDDVGDALMVNRAKLQPY
jgi:hypothetical protein